MNTPEVVIQGQVEQPRPTEQAGLVGGTIYERSNVISFPERNASEKGDVVVSFRNTDQSISNGTPEVTKTTDNRGETGQRIGKVESAGAVLKAVTNRPETDGDKMITKLTKRQLDIAQLRGRGGSETVSEAASPAVSDPEDNARAFKRLVTLVESYSDRDSTVIKVDFNGPEKPPPGAPGARAVEDQELIAA